MEVVITFSIAANATYVGLSLLGYVRIGAGMSLFRGLLTLLICPMYFQPMRAIAAAFHSRERAMAAVPAISELLAGTETGTAGAARVPPPRGPVTVALDNVSFRFPDAAEPVLHGLILTVHLGQWTAVAGPSGAGKTTLLSLIAEYVGRWWNRPMADFCRIRHRHGSEAAPGSVSRPYCCRDRSATTSASEGGRQSGRHLHASPRPGCPTSSPASRGLDTPLGEGGRPVQREARRIAIARAFLSDAGLWVLDEPTAHLDGHRGAAHRCPTQRRRGGTVIVATHSAAVARSADSLSAWTTGRFGRRPGYEDEGDRRAGLLLAVLAKICSVGLLGLSGWSVATSAVAGGSACSTFSSSRRAAGCARSRWAGW